MKHLFLSPHADDAALSCGGLILQRVDAGDRVGVATIFSGSGPLTRLTPYQRTALGFGEEDRRLPSAGGDAGAERDAAVTAPEPHEVMERRRAEDRAYARFAGASIVHLDLPDAVFRDYVGDAELLGDPRPIDPAPARELRALIGDLDPDRVYAPLAVGSHVDHRLVRRAAIALIGPVIPPESLRFYEDFPYAHNVGFDDPVALDAEFGAGLPPGWSLEAEIVPIAGALARKIRALEAYRSQLGRLFGGDDPMSRAVRERAAIVGRKAGIGSAERYWRLTRT